MHSKHVLNFLQLFSTMFSYLWFHTIKKSLDVAVPVFCVGVCYVKKPFVLNPYLEHLSCAIFINVMPKPLKRLVVFEFILRTNKINTKTILTNFESWGEQTPHEPDHV